MGRDAQPLAVGKTGGLKHHPFKALWVAQGGDVQAALPVQVVVQLLQMNVHFRKLHAGIGGYLFRVILTKKVLTDYFLSVSAS